MATKHPKGMSAGSYRSIGKTHDGVTVLAPKTKPTHFTTSQIRSTIKKVLRDNTSGQFMVDTSGRRNLIDIVVDESGNVKKRIARKKLYKKD